MKPTHEIIDLLVLGNKPTVFSGTFNECLEKKSQLGWGYQIISLNESQQEIGETHVNIGEEDL